MSSKSSLFAPISFGHFSTKHRIVLAPLTRLRAGKKSHFPNPELLAEYYAQRSSEPGTLLISEGTIIAPKAGGLYHVPGIWSDEQVAAWKKVTDRVHSNGSFIFVQLAALGRSAMVPVLQDPEVPGGPFDYVSFSPTPMPGSSHTPRELTREEIKEYVQLFVKASERAMEAGFDGVEIHGASAFLVDQSIQDVINKRTDEYGGSIENRSRFTLEILESISKSIGPERVGLRVHPWNKEQGMGMADPKSQFGYLVSEISKRLPTFAYIHAVEPRISGNRDIEAPPNESLDFLRDIWRPTGRPFLSAGGYTPENALEHVEKPGYENEMVVFARHFIANPDLPRRIRDKISLSSFDPSTLMAPESAKGYTDYPFAEAKA